MDRNVFVSMISEANNCLSASLHTESRARRDTIITNQLSRFEAGIDLLFKGLDFNLIVVDVLSGGLVVVGSNMLSNDQRVSQTIRTS